MQKRIPYTAFDHHLIEVAKELFRKLYVRRMLIRLLGVKLTQLVQGTQQLNLFEDTRRVVHLYQTMDRIRNLYGKRSIGRASGKNSLTG
jgi:DNA polymerase-4